MRPSVPPQGLQTGIIVFSQQGTGAKLKKKYIVHLETTMGDCFEDESSNPIIKTNSLNGRKRADIQLGNKVSIVASI